MGTQQSKQNKEQKIKINHYKFKQAKYIKRQEIIRNELIVESDADFQIWQRRLNKVVNIQDQIFLFPKAYQYTRRAICGSSGIIQIDYDNYQYLLLQELRNRQKVKRHFNELQIWYLLYCLVSASYEFKHINSKIGDVRPQNIFINEQGQIKIANIFSWPGQMTNYSKTIINNEKTYLSPEELVSAKQGISQNYIDIFKAESFSIGMTLLQSAILNDMSSLYLPTKQLDFHRLNQILKQWWTLKFRDQRFQGNTFTQYSDTLKLAIASLCQVDKSNRATCQDLLLWLKPFHNKIVELKQFEPGLPPLKNIEKYQSFLKINRKNSLEKMPQQNVKTSISLGNKKNQYYMSKPETIKFQHPAFDQKVNSKLSSQVEEKNILNNYKIGSRYSPNFKGQKQKVGYKNLQSPQFLQKIDQQILVSRSGYQ